MAAIIHALPTAREPQRACSECKFFVPNTGSFGYERRSPLEWLKGVQRTPSAAARMHAICDAFGGGSCSWTREWRCKGSMWKPRQEG